MTVTPTENLEVELKFDVEAGIPAPDLSTITESGSVGAPITYQLTAVYLDTAELTLQRNRITLRRRVGGTDAGWHLKLPGGDDLSRREIAVSFDDAPEAGPVPAELLAQVRAIIRDRDLIDVASLTTERTVTSVYNGDGVEVAVFCADHVRSQVLLPDTDSADSEWSEWEFELTTDDRQILGAAEVTLVAAGARPASSASKLARALAPIAHGRVDSVTPDRFDVGKKSTAVSLVVAAIARYRDALIKHDPGARVDAPDAVHQMRVAARSLRSVLRSYPNVLAPDLTEGVDAELAELGEILGSARDSEVRAAAIAELLADENAPDDLVEAIESRRDADHQRAVKAVRFALSTPRYLALLDRLDAIVTAPRPGRDGDRSAKKVTGHAVEHAHSRVQKAERAMRRLQPWSPDWVEAAHTVRKRAKALRYTVESARSVVDDKQRRLGKHAKKVQSELGDFNDAVVLRGYLADFVSASGLSGRAQFVLGRIDAREQARGLAAVQRYLKLTRF